MLLEKEGQKIADEKIKEINERKESINRKIFFEAFNEETGKEATEQIYNEWKQARELGVCNTIYAFIDKYTQTEQNDNP